MSDCVIEIQHWDFAVWKEPDAWFVGAWQPAANEGGRRSCNRLDKYPTEQEALAAADALSAETGIPVAAGIKRRAWGDEGDGCPYCEALRDRGPNAETLAAIEEAERMAADPTLGKTYASVDELWADLDADDG
jgi:hypothetical protein